VSLYWQYTSFHWAYPDFRYVIESVLKSKLTMTVDSLGNSMTLAA
jgi:hypothetical protein